MKKFNKTPLATAMGTAIVSAFTTTAVNAESNPFAMSELSDGYMQVAQSDNAAGYTVKPWGKKATEASCGEGKCGSMMDGDKMKKGMESVCGAMMKGKEGSCGETKKTTEGKCGEGKCGSMMDGSKMKKGMESACGAMMKGKEGACGEMKKASEMSCGAMMDGGKMKKGMESVCGAMMKGKEGACASNAKTSDE